MWWGDQAAIPLGFEVCDGAAPTTPAATLTGNKPNLLDRFVKGALPATNTQAGLQTGGTNTTPAGMTGGTAITIAQMPAHAHGGRTGDDSPDHSHGFSGYAYGISYGGDNVGVNLAVAPSGFYRQTDGANTRHQHPINPDSGNQPHTHTISAQDNRPAFQEMFFIIRVK